jgi:hypothetical protein
MGCKSTKEERESGVAEIERPLVDYAFDNFVKSNKLDEIFRNKRFELEVNWSYLHIEHEIIRFKRKKLAKSKDPMKTIAKRQLCLFRTFFTNNSDKLQSFTFRADRTTKTTASVSVQKGFQIGGKVDVDFSLPMETTTNIDACKVTGGLSSQINISKTKGKAFEETLTWSVDTKVEVEENKRCCAELIVQEEEFEAEMTIRSTFTCLGDDCVLPVLVKHKRTGRESSVEIPGELIPDILQHTGRFHLVDDNAKESGNYSMYCDTKAIIKAVYGANQMIAINVIRSEGSEQRADQAPQMEHSAAEEWTGPIIEHIE